MFHVYLLTWGNSAPLKIHMKNVKLIDKVTAALAASHNALPQGLKEGEDFVEAIIGKAFPCNYCYEAGGYLPRLTGTSYMDKKSRVLISRFLFAVYSALKKEDPVYLVRKHMKVSSWGRERIFSQPVSLKERYRALPLTPQKRGYRTAIGIEIEGESPYSRNTLSEMLPLFCKVVHDGSIRTIKGGEPAEVVSLLNRDEMEPRLFRLCDKLAKASFSTNKSCGLHVHLDARHLSFEEVCDKAKIATKWLSALSELFPLSRRDNSYAKIAFSRNERYRAVNVCSHGKHRTCEFRLHSSSINYQKILAWIRLCELLFSLRKAPKAGAGCLETLGQLPLAEYERSYWKARHIELNPNQYQGAINTNGNEE